MLDFIYILKKQRGSSYTENEGKETTRPKLKMKKIINNRKKKEFGKRKSKQAKTCMYKSGTNSKTCPLENVTQRLVVTYSKKIHRNKQGIFLLRIFFFFFDFLIWLLVESLLRWERIRGVKRFKCALWKPFVNSEQLPMAVYTDHREHRMYKSKPNPYSTKVNKIRKL